MATPKKNIQTLLIKHLIDKGHVELILPDGIIIEIGVTQEDNHGNVVNCIEDYCYVTIRRDNVAFLIDSYAAGLQFIERSNTMLVEDSSVGRDGQLVKRLDII